MRGEHFGGRAGTGGECQEKVFVADEAVPAPGRDPQRPGQDALRPAAERSAPHTAPPGPVERALAVRLLDAGDDLGHVDAETGERLGVRPGQPTVASDRGKLGLDRRATVRQPE